MSSRSVQVATTVSFHRPLLMMLSRSVQVAIYYCVLPQTPTDAAVQASAYHCYCVLPQTPTDDAVSWEPLSLHVLQAREDHYYSVLPQKPYWWCHQLRTTKFACPPDQRWLPLLCSSTDRSPQCGLWCWRLWTELFQARKQAAMPRLRSAQLHGVSGHRKCDKFWLHSIFSHRKCESFTMQQWMMMMMMMMTTDDPMKVRFTSHDFAWWSRRWCLAIVIITEFLCCLVKWAKSSKWTTAWHCDPSHPVPSPNGLVHQCPQFYTWAENSHMALMGFEPTIFWHALQTSSL